MDAFGRVAQALAWDAAHVDVEAVILGPPAQKEELAESAKPADDASPEEAILAHAFAFWIFESFGQERQCNAAFWLLAFSCWLFP